MFVKFCKTMVMAVDGRQLSLRTGASLRSWSELESRDSRAWLKLSAFRSELMICSTSVT